MLGSRSMSDRYLLRGFGGGAGDVREGGAYHLCHLHFLLRHACCGVHLGHHACGIRWERHFDLWCVEQRNGRWGKVWVDRREMFGG